MAKEYIEREKAFDLITDFAGQASTKSAYSAFWKSAKAIKKIPTADVVSREVFEQFKWERDMALQTLQEHGIGLGEKSRCKMQGVQVL